MHNEECEDNGVIVTKILKDVFSSPDRKLLFGLSFKSSSKSTMGTKRVKKLLVLAKLLGCNSRSAQEEN